MTNDVLHGLENGHWAETQALSAVCVDHDDELNCVLLGADDNFEGSERLLSLTADEAEKVAQVLLARAAKVRAQQNRGKEE